MHRVQEYISLLFFITLFYGSKGSKFFALDLEYYIIKMSRRNNKDYTNQYFYVKKWKTCLAIVNWQ